MRGFCNISRKKVRLVIVIITLTNILTHTYSQENVNTGKIADYVTDFYEWYFTAIRQGLTDEYQPRFAANDNGMSTIALEKYIGNMRRHHYSDSLISKEIQRYQNSSEQISNIEFEKLAVQFEDIDGYESIGCDFFSFYRWTLELEPVDGIKIINIEAVNPTVVVISGQFYNEDSSGRYFWNKRCEATIRLIDDHWKIDYIEIVSN